MQIDTDNPAVVYRDSLSRGSYWAVHHGLTTIAELLDGEGTDPWTFSWWELEYRHTARARRELVERYAPGTVNKMLTVLRGVLKTCWRLGLMDVETYRRAADVANVRAKTLPAGRGVERDEVAALLEACAADLRRPGAERNAARARHRPCEPRRRSRGCGRCSRSPAAPRALAGRCPPRR
jgi:hypothetical protein